METCQSTNKTSFKSVGRKRRGLVYDTGGAAGFQTAAFADDTPKTLQPKFAQSPVLGKYCNFGRRQVIVCPQVCSGGQTEELVDELNLPKQIISCHPSNLSLPDHVDSFVALNGAPGRLEFSEALLDVDLTFDGSMILFENVIQVPYGGGVDNDYAASLPSNLLGIAEL